MMEQDRGRPPEDGPPGMKGLNPLKHNPQHQDAEDLQLQFTVSMLTKMFTFC